MQRTGTVLAASILFVFAAAAAQQPVDVGRQERVDVNLVIIDTLVVDKQGRAVGGLTRDDFLLSVQGRARAIDTFDAICPAEGLVDPEEIAPDAERERIPIQSDRRLVLAFDYYHLSHADRAAALSWGQTIAARDMAPGDGIMVVALADGLRIEQGFSGSPKTLYHTLQRMEHDVSLFGRDFATNSGRATLDNLSVLADVLGQYAGPKSVVLFSEWAGSSNDWDSFFLETAEHAAAARMTIYPVQAAGMNAGSSIAGSPSLARLANESGGRMTRNTNDLSMGYVRARRDLACRYAIGYYADPEVSRRARTVRVRLADGDHEVRAPERIRLWTPEERRRSALRAAFADPGPNDDPLVRAFGYPFRPLSGRAWETMLAVGFKLHVGPEGASRLVGASLAAGQLNLRQNSRKIDFTAPEAGKPALRPVTLYAARKLKPGPHTLTVALGEPESEKVRTTQVEFFVPEVPTGELIVRGPLLARVDPEGIRMRVDQTEAADSKLHELIGDAGFVPMLVAQVQPQDTLIAGWDICALRADVPSGASIERRIRSNLEIVHRFDPIPVDLRGKKKLRCQDGVDKLPGGTLDVGEYRYEVAVVGKGDPGEELGLGLRPFSIDELPPDE